MGACKLTVCIPTYNRPKHIRKQVTDVLNQLNSSVSLLVLDNHSDIPVASLFSEKELSRFTIKRHSCNLGGDANNAHCLEMVDEGWVWLLGDDDCIRPDAVSVIQELIESHSDCCFINTANKRTQLIETYDDFLSYFKIRGAWGKAFFQSACLFNMTLLKHSLFWYYNFLSSQMGQICMIIKHMELNKGQKVFFTTENLIVDKEPGGWDPMKLLLNSLCIIDKFQYCKKKMRPTVFYSLGNMYLDSIASLEKGRFRYLKLINKRLGFVNILRYNYIGVSYFLLAILVPEKTVRKIHHYFAEKYLKKVATAG